jgi:PAS domain S-box-containing protein
MFVLDENFEVAWINEATEQYFGLDRQEVLGLDKRALVDERIAAIIEDSDAFVDTVLATYDDNTYTEQFECHVTPGDEREPRWLEHRSKPIETGTYAGGRIELYYDITDRKHSEQARRKERHEFESLVNAVEEYAIFTLDPDGHVQTWNPGAEQIKGYEADDILGEHFSQFYTDSDYEASVPQENLAAAAEHGSIQDEGWRVRQDGSRFWANVTITAIRDDGDLQGYAKVTRDMTERRRADAERELLYETTRSIAEADTFDAGLQAALQDVCGVTDWEYAEAWIPTDEGTLRRAEADYYVEDLAEFAAFSEAFTFDPGEGLPGRVYESGEFEWTADFPAGVRGEYPRLDEALDADLHSSLGVPVVAQDEVVAVLTFLMRESQKRDERLVSLVTSIAGELGDLIARRRTEERLAQEQELIEQVFETAPIGLSVFGPDREMKRANEWMADVLGPPTEDPIAHAADDLTLLDDDGQPLAFEDRPVGHVFETGDPVFNQEHQILKPDGSTRWVSVNATPFTDRTGDVTRVIATITDITQLKEQATRLERRRDELETELENVFTRIEDAFYALDEEMRFEYVNDRAEELLGRSEGELLGKRVWNPLSVAEDEPIRERFETAMATQEPTTFERYSDSLDIWKIVRVYPSQSGLSVYFTDITERKERERQLEEYRGWTQTLIENVPSGVVALVDEDLRYITFGGTPEGDTDVTREDLEGQPVHEVLPERLAEVVIPRYEAALDGEPSEFVETIDERVYQFYFEPVRDSDGDVFAAIAMSRDITEQKDREHQLRDRIRQQEVVTDLGQRALEDRDLDALMADAAALVADTLDNDYCKVLDLDAEAEELLLRQGVGWHDGIVGEATVSAVENDSQAAYTLATEEPVVVSDITTETRFSGPDLLTDHDVRGGISTIIGSLDDPWGLLSTHDTDPKEFSEQDAAFVQAVANILASAIDRDEYEQELIQQREQLAALNSLSEVTREITDAVINQSTREEIEETVCERLAATDSYLLAWTGEVDPASQTVALRTEAGVEGYLDGITISVAPDDARSGGPTGRALKTGETQVTHDIRDDARHNPWRAQIEQYGFRSSAAIPLRHEDTLYGVLNVYADRPLAFEGQERVVLSQLGEVVGHAIAATERKQALLSDELVELDFEIWDVFADVDAQVETSGTITLDHVVPVGDGEFLVYGTATQDALDTMNGLVEAFPHWESFRVLSEDEPVRFELRVTDPPVLSVVASHGGYIDKAVIEDGDYRMSIHLAPTTDVRQITTAVEEEYPQAKLLRRRQVTRTDEDQQPFQRLVADLTDRQRATLKAAYHAGFFEWPRNASGEDVADSLGVAPPTFHQHLRKAERKVFDAIFSSSAQNAG